MAKKLLKDKLRAVRQARFTGRSGFGFSDRLRGWKLMVGNDQVGTINNVSCYALSNDDSEKWIISFYASPTNRKLAKTFEENEMDLAVEYAKSAFLRIMDEKSSNKELRDMILAKFPHIATKYS